MQVVFDLNPIEWIVWIYLNISNNLDLSTILNLYLLDPTYYLRMKKMEKTSFPFPVFCIFFPFWGILPLFNNDSYLGRACKVLKDQSDSIQCSISVLYSYDLWLHYCVHWRGGIAGINAFMQTTWWDNGENTAVVGGFWALWHAWHLRFLLTIHSRWFGGYWPTIDVSQCPPCYFWLDWWPLSFSLFFFLW